MSMKTIDDLPDEVLLKIFELLEGNSELKSCCLTQSRWNDLIGSSYDTMKKFYLKLSYGNVTTQKDITVINQLTRAYHSLWIDSSPGTESSKNDRELFTSGVKKILEVHGPKLKTMRLRFADLLHFEEVIKLTPLLESLELSHSKLHETASLNVPQLKHLKLYDCSDDSHCETVFSDLDGLVSLEFSKVNKKHISQLLMRQSSLQFLKVKQFPELFQDGGFQTLHQVPFRLKKLEIEGEYISSLADNQRKNFEAFLKLHRDSLESFTVTGSHFTPNVAELLFTSPFKNLRSLEFSTEVLSHEKSFYYAMPTLDNVKTLKLLGTFRKADVSKLLMSKFTAVETLHMEKMSTSRMSSKFLKTIAAYQQNLKHLSIKNLFKGTPINLHFKNLKSFTVTSIHDIPIWMNFVLAHLSLEEITINKVEKMLTAEHVRSLVVDLPNLKSVTFGGNVVMIKRISESLKDASESLNDQKTLRPCSASGQIDHRIAFNFKSESKDPQTKDKLIETSQIYLGNE